MTLAVDGLCLSRGWRALFSGLSFQLAPGSALVLRGANGSGKTSLLRVLAGLTGADSGTIRWHDETWTALSTAQRATALYLGHANALKDELTAAENLAQALTFDGADNLPDETQRAIEYVGLESRQHLPARKLSQGQKRRIGLARLHVARKKLWLLDEPTNALDAEGVALFASLIGAHLARGGIACIATHLELALDAPLQSLTLGDEDGPSRMHIHESSSAGAHAA